jgi:hypothetical protein
MTNAENSGRQPADATRDEAYGILTVTFTRDRS